MGLSYSGDMLLVRQALKGDQHAFRKIVELNEDRIAKVVIGFLGNTPEAEDVGQEVFIRFFQSMDRYKGDAALSTYLTRIAINLSLNALKKREKERKSNLDDVYHTVKSEDEHLKKETTDLVTQALQRLEPEFRSVVVLRMIEGFSTKETAEILKIPAGTVLSRLSRAQKKLKDWFQKEKMILL
jgi:RNA polymerase sigma-70 factor (ECF subfamily)